MDAYLDDSSRAAPTNGVHRGPTSDRAVEWRPSSIRSTNHEVTSRRTLLEHARRTDVYVGCAPRTRRSGHQGRRSTGLDPVGRMRRRGLRRALQRSPAARADHRLGLRPNCHAYWPLTRAAGSAARPRPRTSGWPTRSAPTRTASTPPHPPPAGNLEPQAHSRRPRRASAARRASRASRPRRSSVSYRSSATTVSLVAGGRAGPRRTATTRCSTIEPRVYVPTSRRAPGPRSQGRCPFHEDAAEPARLPDAGARAGAASRAAAAARSTTSPPASGAWARADATSSRCGSGSRALRPRAVRSSAARIGTPMTSCSPPRRSPSGSASTKDWVWARRATARFRTFDWGASALSRGRDRTRWLHDLQSTAGETLEHHRPDVHDSDITSLGSRTLRASARPGSQPLKRGLSMRGGLRSDQRNPRAGLIASLKEHPE